MRRYLFPWHHKVRLQLAVDGAIQNLSSQFSFLDHCVGHFCVAAGTLIERPGTLTQEFLLWKRCAKKWRRSSGADETSDRRNADKSTEKQPTGQTRADEPSQGLVGVPTRVAARPPTNAKGLNTTISSVHSVNSVLSCSLCPQRLAHAAGYTDFVDAPTPRRSFSFVRTAHRRNLDSKNWPQVARQHCCSWYVFQRVFHAPLGHFWQNHSCHGNQYEAWRNENGDVGNITESASATVQ